MKHIDFLTILSFTTELANHHTLVILSRPVTLIDIFSPLVNSLKNTKQWPQLGHIQKMEVHAVSTSTKHNCFVQSGQTTVPLLSAF